MWNPGSIVVLVNIVRKVGPAPGDDYGEEVRLHGEARASQETRTIVVLYRGALITPPGFNWVALVRRSKLCYQKQSLLTSSSAHPLLPLPFKSTLN